MLRFFLLGAYLWHRLALDLASALFRAESPDAEGDTGGDTEPQPPVARGYLEAPDIPVDVPGFYRRRPTRARERVRARRRAS